jgi:hypothetical protein
MRRFKVKDLLISSVPGEGGGGFLGVKYCLPLTDRKCAKAFTKNCIQEGVTGTKDVPCRDETETDPCAIYSNTDVGCANNNDPNYTERPCIFGGNTLAKDNPCFKMPNKETDTHYVQKCKQNTETEGKFDANAPCSEDSRSIYECARESSKTLHACFRKGEERTKYWCEVKSKTLKECKGEDTAWRQCADGSPRTDFCGSFLTGPGTPYANVLPGCEGAVSGLPCDPASATKSPCPELTSMEIGLNACPPLSPLQLPAEHPMALDALAALHADLRKALGLVETRQDQVGAILTPKTVAEANQVEAALERALAEVRKMKESLAAETAGMEAGSSDEG